MLRALSSASSGQAIALIGGDTILVDVTDGQQVRPIDDAMAALLFSGEDDADIVRATDLKSLGDILEIDWRADRATRMVQIALDADEDQETRADALATLDDLICSEVIREKVLFYTFSFPVASNQNIGGLEEANSRSTAKAMISYILECQSQIKQIRLHWDRLDNDLFENDQARERFELNAIHRGAFFKLGAALHRDLEVDSALFDCYSSLHDEPNSRTIINSWTNEIRTTRKKRTLARESEQGEFSREIKIADRDSSRSGYEIFQNVSEQQAGIINALDQGNTARARIFTKQLIEHQLRESPKIYAVKSLCLLAQEAKQRGQHSIQMEWLQTALDIEPNDGWANGQAGDGYLDIFRYDEAKTCFDRASKFGQAAFGASGKARLLRAKGEYQAAIEAFLAAIEEYSNTAEANILWSGYAETLRDVWRFNDAYEAYLTAVKKFPDDIVLNIGLGRVCRDLGKVDEAKDVLTALSQKYPRSPEPLVALISVYRSSGAFEKALKLCDRASSAFPNNVYLIQARARVMRDSGRYTEALAIYHNAIEQFPNEPNVHRMYADTLLKAGIPATALRVAQNAVDRFPLHIYTRTTHADVLRASGKFKEALQAFERNIRDFPFDAYSMSGRANLLKRLGFYGDSLQAYREIIDKLPNYQHAKVGMATVHVILKNFSAAKELLPTGTPNTRVSWFARHVEGMLLLKQGRLVEAKELFRRSLAIVPFHRERKMLELGLAAANMRLGEFSEVSLSIDESEPIRNILRMHLLLERGDRPHAAIIFGHANDNLPPPLQLLRNAIGNHYGIGNKELNSRTVSWIFDREQDAILQAA